jgi:hypothetical protein
MYISQLEGITAFSMETTSTGGIGRLFWRENSVKKFD